MRPSIFTVILLMSALAGCGDDSVPAGGAEPKQVDHTKPEAVAMAWVRAWWDDRGEHRTYQFASLPARWQGLERRPGEGLSQGSPVREIRQESYGVGPETRGVASDAPDPSPTGFTIGGGPGLEHLPGTNGAGALRYTLTGSLEDGTPFRLNLLVRPEGSFDAVVDVTPDTRWLVMSGHD